MIVRSHTILRIAQHLPYHPQSSVEFRKMDGIARFILTWFGRLAKFTLMAATPHNVEHFKGPGKWCSSTLSWAFFVRRPSPALSRAACVCRVSTSIAHDERPCSRGSRCGGQHAGSLPHVRRFNSATRRFRQWLRSEDRDFIGVTAPGLSRFDSCRSHCVRGDSDTPPDKRVGLRLFPVNHIKTGL